MDTEIFAYGVRFKGHWCAAVRTGYCRKTVLMRERSADERFISLVDMNDPDRPEALMLARLECARAIKRTDEARRRLKGDHFLRGVASVERILRDPPDRRWKGNKRRWRICPIYV